MSPGAHLLRTVARNESTEMMSREGRKRFGSRDATRCRANSGWKGDPDQ